MFELMALMFGGLFFLPALAVFGGIAVACWAGWLALKTVWYVFWGVAFGLAAIFVLVPLAVGGAFVGLLAALF